MGAAEPERLSCSSCLQGLSSSLRSHRVQHKEANEARPDEEPRLLFGSEALRQHPELEKLRTDSLTRWAILGAGAVGLALAMRLDRLMEMYGWDPKEATISVYDAMIERDGMTGRWVRNARQLQGVVTLQDDVVDAICGDHQELSDLFDGAAVRPGSRNCRLADLEARLLAAAQAAHGSRVELKRPPPEVLGGTQSFAEWMQNLDADVIVAAEEASSLLEALRWPRRWLGEDVDFMLRASLAAPAGRPQAEVRGLNRLLTLSQGRYGLDSEEADASHLYVRLTREEYECVVQDGARVEGGAEEEVRQVHFDALPDEAALLARAWRLREKEHETWLKLAIQDGLTFFGMSDHQVQGVVGLRRRAVFLQDFFGLVPHGSGRHRPLLLVGGAGLSRQRDGCWPDHHGVSSALRAAAAATLMWSGGGGSVPIWNSLSLSLRKFQDFMRALRDTSAIEEGSLPPLSRGSAATLLPRWIADCMLHGGSSKRSKEAECCTAQEDNRLQLLKVAKAWHDTMRNSGGWPWADSPSDDNLKERILEGRPAGRGLISPVAAAILLASARHPEETERLENSSLELLPDPADAIRWSWALPDKQYKRHRSQQALELNVDDVAAWCELGNANGGAVAGVEYTDKDCFVRALTLDASCAEAWSRLGAAGGGAVGGVSYGRKECYQQALEADAECVSAWCSLGRLGGGTVQGVEYTGNQCCRWALWLDVESHVAWNALGTVGGGFVAGEYYSPKECHMWALELDASHVPAWSDLGHNGGGTVAGVEYSSKQCYLRALELNANYAVAWSNLGHAGGGTVDGVQYTDKECYLRALELDPEYSYAWNNLGHAGGGTVAGEWYSDARCYRRTLELNPNYALAWSNLGHAGGGEVSGVHYNRTECYLWALHLDAQNSLAWNNLGAIGGGTLAGVSYSNTECYEQALKIDGSHALAWSNLGLAGGGTVAGVAYTARQCFEKNLEFNSSNSFAWNHLGQRGGGTVKGVQYTDKQCYLSALEFDERCALGWSNLGTTGGGSFRGVAYSPRDCYLRALELDEKHALAWSHLGRIGGHTFRGREYTEKGCYEKALELDARCGPAWSNLGRIGGGKVSGLTKSKKECCKRALDIDAEDASTWENLGLLGGGTVGGVVHTMQQCLLKARQLREHPH